MTSPLPIKTALTIACLAFLLWVPDLLPPFKDYKVLDFATVPAVLDFKSRRSANPVGDERARLRPDLSPENAAVYPIAGTEGSMDGFYAALRRVERGQSDAQVRILHYGDSPTTADMITADVRALLQKQFGDGGHGFHLIAKPWAWYEHRGVIVSAEGWTIDPANQSRENQSPDNQGRVRDGKYGLGGVSFRGGAGAFSRFRFREPLHTAVEIAYMAQPGGGKFSISADGATIRSVSSAAEIEGPAFVRVTLPKGAKEFELHVNEGDVRLFGADFHRGTRGVVYHSLGLNGAYISVPARMFGERHWAGQLQHYKPDLVVINYGTNETVQGEFVDKYFGKELRAVILRIRRAVPGASILVMSPMDRGQRQAGGEIGTVPALSRLVEIERKIAAEEGCAFFNTFLAMGGQGTMGRWYQAEPRLVGADLIHPMPAGGRIVGNLLYRAILDGYQKYKTRLLNQKLKDAVR